MQLPAYRVTDESTQKGACSERAWHDTFSSAHGDVIELTGQHSQAGEDPLLAILSRLRVGDCRDENLSVLNSTWPDDVDDWPNFQHLRAKVCDAQAYKKKRLAAMIGATGTFSCRDEVPPQTSNDAPRREPPDLNKVAAATVTVKVGAQVVCTMSFGVVKTGTRGVVSSFIPEESVCCRFDGVDEAVAMPLVKFSVMDEDEQELACRWQVPILLSWAVTVSRAQGMTISKVAVDFSCTSWTLDGLVYAALSRAVSLSSLRVRGLTRDHVKTSATALAWYESVRSERLFREYR